MRCQQAKPWFFSIGPGNIQQREEKFVQRVTPTAIGPLMQEEMQEEQRASSTWRAVSWALFAYAGSGIKLSDDSGAGEDFVARIC
jgi:hypothetical protein